jgi:hypothetical protein
MLMLMLAPLADNRRKKNYKEKPTVKEKKAYFFAIRRGRGKKKEAQLQYTNDFVKKKKGTLFLHGKTNSQGS